MLYSIEPFNKVTFDNLNLNNFDHEVLFDIDPSLYDNFNAVQEHLQAKYKGIDFDNAEICMFNLNNYLDNVTNDGVYRSEHSTYAHDGFVVLLDPEDLYMQNRIVARVSWSYIAGKLDIDFNVKDLAFFNETLVSKADPQSYNDYWSVSSIFLDRKAGLKMHLRNSDKRIEKIEKCLNEEKQHNADIQRRIDEFDKQ